ncbi:MAG: MBL fold metallo-hydrolase RNA specificity domain-containing protein [Bacillota bacterium]
MDTIKITFYGAARVVTGSCYLIEHGKTKFLVDCGMFQGPKKLKEKNYGSFPFNPEEIDFVLLTHAHIDHSGLIPKLYKAGFSGHVYATYGTVELCNVMLPDSGHIQEMEVERKNRKNQRLGLPLISPIYTVEDADECTQYFIGIEYEKEFEPRPGIIVKMRDAGHILGSAIFEIKFLDGEKESKMVFTGDLGRINRPIVNDPALVEEADYLVIESTYGDRLHEQLENNVDNNADFLADIINETLNRNGNVIIPSFAVDRTQGVLFTLNRLIIDKKINPQGIYLDSPLAIAATEIFCRYPEYYDKETTAFMKKHGACPFDLGMITYSRSAEDSKALNEIKNGAIIISASGMADAGRIKHHLKHNLWRPECTIIFAGYQAEGTLGRRLVDGEKIVRIHGEEVKVNAQILKLEGYSAHADQQELINWLKEFKKIPEKIFVTHGEEQVSLNFAQELYKQFKSDIKVPSIGECLDLTKEDLVSTIQSDFAVRGDNINILYAEIIAELSRLFEGEELNKLKEIKNYLKKISA